MLKHRKTPLPSSCGNMSIARPYSSENKNRGQALIDVLKELDGPALQDVARQLGIEVPDACLSCTLRRTLTHEISANRRHGEAALQKTLARRDAGQTTVSILGTNSGSSSSCTLSTAGTSSNEKPSHDMQAVQDVITECLSLIVKYKESSELSSSAARDLLTRLSSISCRIYELTPRKKKTATK